MSTDWWRVFTTLFFNLSIFAADSLDLHPVYWNSSNPMFKTSNNDHVIDVSMHDSIDFFCPYYQDETGTNSWPEYYHIYQVSRKEYEDCNLSHTDHRRRPFKLHCVKPNVRTYYTINFVRFTGVPNAPEFIEGETYYYITTSTGSYNGLDNVHQGACLYRNMRLKIRVCCGATSTSPSPTPAAQNMTAYPSLNASTTARPLTVQQRNSTTAGSSSTKASTTTTSTTTTTTSPHLPISSTDDLYGGDKNTPAKPPKDGSEDKNKHHNSVDPKQDSLTNSAEDTRLPVWGIHFVVTCILTLMTLSLINRR